MVNLKETQPPWLGYTEFFMSVPCPQNDDIPDPVMDGLLQDVIAMKIPLPLGAASPSPIALSYGKDHG